jgi:hypothetical protein
MIPLFQLAMAIIQFNLGDWEKYAQISLALLAYLGIGGSIAGLYISQRLSHFEKRLFTKMDAKFATKEVCDVRHPWVIEKRN